MNPLSSLILYSGIWRDLLRIFKKDVTAQADELFREARGGSIKPTDAMIVAKLLCRHKPKNVLEIGSFLGVSTRLLLDVSTPWNAHITAVDPNIPHRFFNEPRRFVEQLCSLHSGDRLKIVSAFFGTPVRQPPGDIPVIDAGWDESFDTIFIDGDHTYEAVADSFRLSLQLLAPQGVFCFMMRYHGRTWPGFCRKSRRNLTARLLCLSWAPQIVNFSI